MATGCGYQPSTVLSQYMWFVFRRSKTYNVVLYVFSPILKINFLNISPFKNSLWTSRGSTICHHNFYKARQDYTRTTRGAKHHSESQNLTNRLVVRKKKTSFWTMMEVLHKEHQTALHTFHRNRHKEAGSWLAPWYLVAYAWNMCQHHPTSENLGSHQ